MESKKKAVAKGVAAGVAGAVVVGSIVILHRNGQMQHVGTVISNGNKVFIQRIEEASGKVKEASGKVKEAAGKLKKVIVPKRGDLPPNAPVIKDIKP